MFPRPREYTISVSQLFPSARKTRVSMQYVPAYCHLNYVTEGVIWIQHDNKIFKPKSVGVILVCSTLGGLVGRGTYCYVFVIPVLHFTMKKSEHLETCRLLHNAEER